MLWNMKITYSKWPRTRFSNQNNNIKSFFFSVQSTSPICQGVWQVLRICVEGLPELDTLTVVYWQVHQRPVRSVYSCHVRCWACCCGFIWGCWMFITGDVLGTNVLSCWSNMTAGSPKGTSICHGDHVWARGLRATLDDTKFPLLVMWIKYAHWITRVYGRKELGRLVVLRFLLILSCLELGVYLSICR